VPDVAGKFLDEDQDLSEHSLKMDYAAEILCRWTEL